MTDETVMIEPADAKSGDASSGEGARVKRAFWPKLRRVAAAVPFIEDLLAAYYCAFDRQTPRHVQAALIGAIGYFVLPFDAIPDMLPVLGFADDAAMLAGVIRLFTSHITPAHRDAAKRAISGGLTPEG